MQRRLVSWLWAVLVRLERLPAAPVAVDWLPEDQAAWVTFLRTTTGQRLLARMRAIESQVAINACQDVFHTAHSAGMAKGWHEALTWLQSLSRSSRVHEDQAPDGAPDNPPGGDPALVERYSP
ncbi:MAG TPA: hypothetical protein VHA37_04500 [Candidatus Saccharimonadales bacterium]|nr:hypothetical protein [Candidatus Saccharimonadales bacterium]